ncbi:hypothetical protein Zmor_006758 [Zophobas morio]|uniref:Uncharacterized protein n=1 Tax=Zophobas morio TaxID=2755281 RepID=A0AA38MNU2_9CUCU|nr:hypothetical protein Zmor_006758 [Zophobas morio]
MVYSVEQNTFIVMSYYRNGTFVDGAWLYSVAACKQEYLANYPDLEIQETSLKAHIRDVINRFVRTSNVNKGKSSGRPAVSEEVVDDLRERLEQNPQTSLTRLSQQSGVPVTTCHKVVKKRLHMHPYKITTVQQLLPIDPPRRVEYCNWFQNTFHDDGLLDLTFFSDEAWQQILEPFIQQLDDEELQLGYFQQDGATAHTARVQRAFPPRSPDLTPLDFSIFGYLKDKVFQRQMNNLAELQHEIEQWVQSIDGRMLQNIFESKKKRVNMCLELNGEHFQHLL